MLFLIANTASYSVILSDAMHPDVPGCMAESKDPERAQMIKCRIREFSQVVELSFRRAYASRNLHRI